MSRFNISLSRDLLKEFKFEDLFVDELGWNQASFSRPRTVSVDESEHKARPIAELSGIVVFEISNEKGKIPDSKTRRAVQREIEKLYHEHLLIFLDRDRKRSVWYWVKRDGSKRYPRSNTFLADQSGDLLLSKISAMFVDMSELDAEGKLPVVEAAQRVKAAFDVERVTKKFYDEFRKVHLEFLESIEGINDESERRWYSSVILNRLMFIYFLQRKGFVDRGNQNYLQDKLQESQAKSKDHYYEDFLKLLFFEGFAKPADQRSPEAQKTLGDIRFLNGGLFLPHHIELKWPDIAIPDGAFEKLYGVFERYSWNLDDTPGGSDDEINPDVLGYIFEKYINQKAFGAYYTRPEITEYLCEQTIHKLILDKLEALNEPLPGVPPPPTYESASDLLLKLDASRAKQLLFTDNGGVLSGLSLLDPACGSGAFLVAAMKTLLEIYRAVMGRIPALKDRGLREWLDQVDRDHPSRDYFIKKRIITDNLFGVDIMAEAVEIARLRLFLALVSSAESVDDLEPLPNIDFNILPGNSLIGLLQVDESRFDAFAADSAMQGEADQGSFFPTMKQSSMLPLISAASYKKVVGEKTAMVHQYRHAAERADLRDNADAVQALRDQIEAHRQENIPVLNEILLDEFQDLGIQYEQATWNLKKNKAGKSNKRNIRLSDIETLQPFHWGYEFHEVMNKKGGFDAIITNPPWEVLQTDEKEFFQQFAPTIQKKNLRIEDWKKQRRKIMEDDSIRNDWLDYASRFPYQSNYFKKAKQYSHQSIKVNGRSTGGKLNLYNLFVEQCFNLLAIEGYCGIIVPSGIYTDFGATGLRNLLFTATSLGSLYGLSNERWIFEEVHHAQKFCIFTFMKGDETHTFDGVFRINPREAIAPERLDGFLNDQSNLLLISVPLIHRISPGSLSVPEFDSITSIDIAEKMTRYPSLGEHLQENWNLRFTTEFNKTTHSDLFKSEPGMSRLPLYEGKNIHQFTHTWESPTYWLEEQEARDKLTERRNREIKLLIKKNNLHEPEENTDFELDYDNYRLAFRDVAASTNERTLIASVLPPKVFCPHTTSLERVFEGRIIDGKLEPNYSNLDNATRLFVAGLFNSFAVDYLIRQKVTNHLSFSLCTSYQFHV